MKFKKRTRYNVQISPTSNNGYLVEVGCETFVFTEPDALIEALTFFFKDPEAAEEAFCHAHNEKPGEV